MSDENDTHTATESISRTYFSSKNYKDVDTAWEFLNRHRGTTTAEDAGTVDITALRHKVILNYAAVMGLRQDLDLQGNDFSDIAAFLFFGLLGFEPNVLSPGSSGAKWLGLNVTLWGVATACGAASHNYQTLLVTRVFLGMFEATIGPSLMLISSQWYTKSEQAPTFSFWYTGLGIGQILGGAISYGFQHIAPGQTSLEGWRIMFVTLGCVTVIIGLSTAIFIPDTPMQAGWLSDADKVALLQHISINQTGIQSREFRPKEILEALCDSQLYRMLLSVVLVPWITGCLIPVIIGGALMSFLPVTNRNGILAGLYLVNAVVALLAIFYNWTAANFGGATKRAFAAATVSGSFSLGNIIGPQTFQSRDAPDFHPAKLAVMSTQAGCAVKTFALFLYYIWQNKRRWSRAEQRESDFLSPEVWSTMNDKENKQFRYIY
ncbi:hypothetical protein V2G26_002909 [Clonostachys chloroleuca]